MGIIQEHSLLIIGLLLVLLLISIFVNFRKKRIYHGDSNESSHGGFVSREKFNLVFNQRNEESQERERFENLYNDYRERYEGARVEIDNLKRKIDELTRDNNELNVLYGNDSTTNVDKRQAPLENPAVVHSHEDEISKETKGVQHTMYTSFPRSAGSSIYFSDLTDKLSDDSYFELRITNDSGLASFRPLDFMKIRNYDPAMAAILTEGVKPNVASTVVGVESGEAQLEGNDWIIKRLAKVKLA